MLRVGVIGLGHMGLLHLRNTRFIDGIDVTAAADKSKKGFLEAKSYGIKNLYENYEDLLANESLDAVIISLPNYLHEKAAIQAAEQGMDIFIEKPLARKVSECKNIENAVRRNGVKLCVGHNYRYFEHVQGLKKELDLGTIGDVEIANLEHFVNGPFAHPLNPVPVQEWWLDPTLAGGGVLLDQGVHLIDLFRWLFPESKPVLRYAHLGHRYGLPIEDSAILMLESQTTPTKGIISVGWFQKMVFPDFNFRINLHGTAKFLSTDNFSPKNLYFHAAKEAARNCLLRLLGKKIKPLSYTYYYSSYFRELQNFFENIGAGNSPLVTVEDGIEVIRIIEEAYKSAEPKPQEILKEETS